MAQALPPVDRSTIPQLCGRFEPVARQIRARLTRRWHPSARSGRDVPPQRSQSEVHSTR